MELISPEGSLKLATTISLIIMHGSLVTFAISFLFSLGQEANVHVFLIKEKNKIKIYYS